MREFNYSEKLYPQVERILAKTGVTLGGVTVGKLVEMIQFCEWDRIDSITAMATARERAIVHELVKKMDYWLIVNEQASPIDLED